MIIVRKLEYDRLCLNNNSSTKVNSTVEFSIKSKNSQKVAIVSYRMINVDSKKRIFYLECDSPCSFENSDEESQKREEIISELGKMLTDICKAVNISQLPIP